MTTALDIIKGALRKIGQYASGETIDNDDAADALAQFNGMLDVWSNQHLTVYTSVENVVNFTAGQSSYTVGSGGNFNVQRPLRITQAYTRLTPSGSTMDYPCEIVALDRYAGIGLKTQPGPWPKMAFYNPGFPLGTLEVWPVPTANYEFHFWADQVFSAFASLSTAVSMPPGYVLAMQTNLACLLAPEYGVQPSAELKEQARAFLRAIKDTNDTPQIQASYDPVLTSTRGNDAGFILHGGF